MNIRSGIDLLQLIGRDTQLKKVANTRGGEYAGACPRCADHGVDRLRVQPETGLWCCRQCHEKWGDAIEYIRWRDGVDFKTALAILNIPLESLPRISRSHTPLNPNAPKALESNYVALNDDDWQEQAQQFSDEATRCLWRDEGRAALAYLEGRGISRRVIADAGLGYNPTDYMATWGLTEIWLPRGIVIGWQIDGKYWRVNVRPPAPVNGKKYIQATGGANGLYNADAIKSDRTVVMTEGEFDSLIIRTYAPEFVAVATGTVSWARLLRWTSLLSITDNVLLSFDTDHAGSGAAEWWQGALGDKAIRHAPTAHDVNDMWSEGKDIRQWLAPYSLCYSVLPSPENLEFRAAIRDVMQVRGYMSRIHREVQAA